MLKSLCILSLLALPLAAAAQQPIPRIRQLYIQDQRDRGIPYAANGHDLLSEADAKKLPVVSDNNMGTHDMARRAEALKLLQIGALHTAEDFSDAAMIFQHGSTPDDFLLAHVLAIEAIARGDTSAHALGLAAVTLDRYLQWSGKKQIFGTQYLPAQFAFSLQHPNDKNLDQELKKIPASNQTLQPYNQTLLPDAIRADFCVPPQQQQLNYITAANSGKPVDLPQRKNCDLNQHSHQATPN
ncbi:MAG: hypothetical protein WBY53_02340 [Acidobacteriaceae bacterium]